MQAANMLTSLYAKAQDVPAATAFWTALLGGQFGPIVSTPTSRSITSMLRLFASQGCPVEWSQALLGWYGPDQPHRDNLAVDSRVITAALAVCRRRRDSDLARAWFKLLVARAGEGAAAVVDRFVVKDLGAILGKEAAEAAVREAIGKHSGRKPQ